MGYSHFSLTSGYDGRVWNTNASATVVGGAFPWKAKQRLSARIEDATPLHPAVSFHPSWLQINLGSPGSLSNSLQYRKRFPSLWDTVNTKQLSLHFLLKKIRTEPAVLQRGGEGEASVTAKEALALWMQEAVLEKFFFNHSNSHTVQGFFFLLGYMHTYILKAAIYNSELLVPRFHMYYLKSDIPSTSFSYQKKQMRKKPQTKIHPPPSPHSCQHKESWADT